MNIVSNMKLYYLFLLVFLLFSCTPGQSGFDNLTIISGKVSNQTDRLVLLDAAYQEIARISIDKQGVFSDTLDIVTGFYHFKYGRNRHRVFMKPGTKLHFELGDEVPKEGGRLSQDHICLGEIMKLEDDFNNDFPIEQLVLFDELDFLKIVDSLHEKKIDLFDSFQYKMSSDFKEYERVALEINRAYKIANYENSKRFFSGNITYKVSDEFPDVLKGIDLQNEVYINIPFFKNILTRYLRNQFDRDVAKQNGEDVYLKDLQVLSEKIENIKIQEWLAKLYAKRYLPKTDSLDAYYQLAKSMVRDTSFLDELKNDYTALNPLTPGKPVPDFSFSSIENKQVSLKDFKGKLVYLDIWATWCKPCIQEFPFKKTLKSTFENQPIAFVSICVDDDKSKWEKMVENRELGGTQLFADRTNEREFFNQIKQKGYPTYILIDDKGNFIDRYATRPSDPRTKERIESLLF